MNLIRSRADLDRGLEGLLASDPRLALVAQVAGPLPLRLAEPGFAGLASIIVSQMISRASADAIWRRIVATGPVSAPGFLALDLQVVGTFGLSKAKTSTLYALADAVTRGDVDLHGLCALETREALHRLTLLPGIGPWTAQVYLMFCAGHPDLFPCGDVALQAAVGRAFSQASRPCAKDLLAMAEAWSPYRSIAARLFWAYYAATANRNAAPLV